MTLNVQAQGLSNPVTGYKKFLQTDHTIYIATDREGKSTNAIGLLKVGRKNLYLHDTYGNLRHVQPLCVLDFYVHESQQRQGYGLRLFGFMLQDQNVKPHCLAIDRPSSKMISFLKRHYCFSDIELHSNSFGISPKFFSECQRSHPEVFVSKPRLFR
ncbi:Alpha-tubulin N-acetyltransferase 1 [Cichlidogyrus casuarinus]|uniref:Alpha-tubulin N-acetyltransferase 1 n=1 Tax=Cichlidogyrus casuarinus TaxID=1844966 RepID=A0ABD2Q011_9PLAT